MSTINYDVIRASSLPPMTEEEVVATTTIISVDGSGRLRQIPRSVFFRVISDIVARGEKGDKGDKGDRGEQGLRGVQGEQGIRGLQGVQGEQGLRGLQGARGTSGWSPVYSLKPRGATDQVIEVTNWTNPDPTAMDKPASPVYITANGLSPDISLAINIKGTNGTNGTRGDRGERGEQGLRGLTGGRGWTPIIATEVVDNKAYFKVTNWVNGEGTPPPELGYISSEGLTDLPIAGSEIINLPINVSFANISGKPTTVAGYGITNAYTKAEIDDMLENTISYTNLVDKPTLLSNTGLTDVYTKNEVDTLVGEVEETLTELFKQGVGSPEGVVDSETPSLYVDSGTGEVYSKTTSSGNTGWIKLAFVP
jgi:hypothetical protein